MEDDEDAASELSGPTLAADHPRDGTVQSSKQLRVVHQAGESEGANRKIDVCAIDCKGAVYRRNRQLFEAIANQEMRNAGLKAEEEGIRKRFEMMEIVMPALMARDILRQRDKPDFNVGEFLKRKLQADQGYFSLPCEPSSQHNVRIRELEAEKKKEKQRLEEARAMWEEIKQVLEKKRSERNELLRLNEELELKYDDLVDEYQQKQEKKKQEEEEKKCDGFNCLELGLRESESATSITSASLECIIKLQEVAETTLSMKRNIADLERRECEYMRTLQCAGQILSKKNEIGKKDLKWKQKLCSSDEDLSDPEYSTCPEDACLEDSDYEGEPCPRETGCFDRSQMVGTAVKSKSEKPLMRTKNDWPIKTKEWRSRPREGASKVDKTADPVPLEGQGDSAGDNLRSDGMLGVPKEELESWLEIAQKMHRVVSKCSEGKSVEPVVEKMGQEISTHLKTKWKERKRSSSGPSRESKDQEYPKGKEPDSLEARTSAVFPLIEKVSSEGRQRESKMRTELPTQEAESQSPMARSFDASTERRESRKRKLSTVEETRSARTKSKSVSTDDLIAARPRNLSRDFPTSDSQTRTKSRAETVEDLKSGGSRTKSREFQAEKEVRRSSGRESKEVLSEEFGIPSKIRRKESDEKKGEKNQEKVPRMSKESEKSVSQVKSGSRSQTSSSQRPEGSPLRRISKSFEKSLDEKEVQPLDLERVTGQPERLSMSRYFSQRDKSSTEGSEKKGESQPENVPRSSASVLESKRTSELQELQSPLSSRMSRSSKISTVLGPRVSDLQKSLGQKSPELVTQPGNLPSEPENLSLSKFQRKRFSRSDGRGSTSGISPRADDHSSKMSLESNIISEHRSSTPKKISMSEKCEEEGICPIPERFHSKKSLESNITSEHRSSTPKTISTSEKNVGLTSSESEKSLASKRTAGISPKFERSSSNLRKQSTLENISETQEPDVPRISQLSENQNSPAELVELNSPRPSTSSGITHDELLSINKEKVTGRSMRSEGNKISSEEGSSSQRLSGSEVYEQIRDSHNREIFTSKKSLDLDGNHSNLVEPISLAQASQQVKETEKTSLVKLDLQSQPDQSESAKASRTSKISLQSEKDSDTSLPFDYGRHPSSYLTIMANRETGSESKSSESDRPITEIQKFQEETKSSSNSTSEVLKVENLSGMSAIASDKMNDIPTVTKVDQIFDRSDFLRAETRELELSKLKTEEMVAESIPKLIEFVEQSNEQMRRTFKSEMCVELAGMEILKSKIPQTDVKKITKPPVVQSAVKRGDEKPTGKKETKKSHHIKMTIGENVTLSRLRYLLDDCQLDKIIASQPLDQPRRLSRRSKVKLKLVCADSQTPFGGYQQNISRVADRYKFQTPMKTFSSGDSESESICKCEDFERDVSPSSSQSDWSFPSEENPRPLTFAVKRIT